jgi:Uncharacterised nucleotidyltransferase
MRVALAQAMRLHFQPEAAGAFRAAIALCGLTERLLIFADTCYALPLLASAIRRAGLRPACQVPGARCQEEMDPLSPGTWHLAPGTVLDTAYYACAARKVALLALIERVADVLGDGGIPFLLLKGAALEVLAPRAPGVRVTADLDVLVPRGNMTRAERLLDAAGFQPRYAGHSDTFRRYGHHSVPYEAGRGLGAVEVHEALAPRGASVRLPTEPFWRRSRTLLWRQRVIRLPAAEELVLHTCAHYGLLHPYNTALRRLWDLALLLGTVEELIDWDYVSATARRWGARKVVEQGLSELAWLMEGQRRALRGARCVEEDLLSSRAQSPAPSARRATPPEEWPLFEAPYSALAAFCLEQRATDNAWGRLRGLWRFLLPGPHETAPLRAEGAHWRYLVARFARVRRLSAPGSRLRAPSEAGSWTLAERLAVGSPSRRAESHTLPVSGRGDRPQGAPPAKRVVRRGQPRAESCERSEHDG